MCSLGRSGGAQTGSRLVKPGAVVGLEYYVSGRSRGGSVRGGSWRGSGVLDC